MNPIIVNINDLDNAYVHHEGFVITSLCEPFNVLDTVVIRNPENATCDLRMGFSSHNLEEHIHFINENKIEKAIIIADNIDFISRCPSLKYLQIIPADSAADSFDFSPIYNLPQVKMLDCRTVYGKNANYSSTVDYSKINGLSDLTIYEKDHCNYNKIDTLEKLHICDFVSRKGDLTDLFSSTKMKELSLIECEFESLNGLGRAKELTSLSLGYNNSLKDISELAKCAETLKHLSIDCCNKITDFSVLNKLTKLEELVLIGENRLSNLDFLKSMPNLKDLLLDMETEK